MRRLALLTLLSATSAHAGAFYVETGGGLSQMRNADTYFSGATSGTGNLGPGVNLSIFYSFSNNAPLDFHFGIQNIYASGSDISNFSTDITYVMLRMQASLFYIGGGYSPYVMSSVGQSPGINGLTRDSTASAYMGEAGVLWAVTPKFSLGAGANVQFVSANGAVSPMTYEALGFMRFYFGFIGGSGPSGRSNEFQGWRYPFGNPIR